MADVDGDTMMVDVIPADASQQTTGKANHKETAAKKSLKRKRAVIDGSLTGKDKESLTAECRQEIDDLFAYYKKMTNEKLDLGGGAAPSLNSAVACLIEESNASFSKLVEEVYEKLKAEEGNRDVNLASVRSAVLFVGQRMMYGIPNPDADVLEDNSETCLWCWETRDMKLLPTTQRGILNVRRIARKKTHERISALSATLSALSTPESHETYKSDLLKASEKLGRALNGMRIHSLVEKLKQKNDADMAEKGAKLKEKELMKENVRNKQNTEKEKKRLDREFQKEMLQTEKEVKRLQDESLREEKRREKEEAELKKQLKKQQEEAERDQRRQEKEEAELRKQLKKQEEEAEREQRRREKEEAEMKKQISIQKQATIMERFLKSKKSNNSSDSDKLLSTEALVVDSSCKQENVVNTTTLLIDNALSQKDSLTVEDLFKLHVAGWHKLHRSNRSCRWGIRQNPKTEVIKELKLQGPSSDADTPRKVTTPNRRLDHNKVNCKSTEQGLNNLVDGGEETVPDDASRQHNVCSVPTCARLLIKKLLQFDKSHRPAYYGTWRKNSSLVGPRYPFMKDPDLDYDVDSDEEWEEEDPGESLSDCEKDEVEEHLEEGNSKSDEEDESEDGFFVPDGYLSENEGVQADILLDDMEDEEARSSQCCKPEVESEEFRALMRQQKYLNNLTEQALRKSQTLVITNLMHEKSELIMAEGLTGTQKLEQICLQALRMRSCHGVIIDISTDHNTLMEDQEVCQSQNKITTSPAVSPAPIPDPDMLEFVSSIRACSQGINKVIDSLQLKFPTISKKQLRNKVREISHFVDNRWQVKKEVLDRLGLPLSPNDGMRTRGIATFFSKRCLPPVAETMNIPGSQQCLKIDVHHGEDGRCSSSAQIQPAP